MYGFWCFSWMRQRVASIAGLHGHKNIVPLSIFPVRGNDNTTNYHYGTKIILNKRHNTKQFTFSSFCSKGTNLSVINHHSEVTQLFCKTISKAPYQGHQVNPAINSNFYYTYLCG
jgi:hypothetical protein